MTPAKLVNDFVAGLKTLAADKARMRFLRLSLIWIAIVWVVATTGASTFSKHYRIGLDFEKVRCMPWHVYILKLSKPDLARGVYVAYRDTDGLMGPKFKGKTMGKMVAGMPGDHVVVRNDFAWVNGQPIGALIHNAKLGRGPGGFDRDEIVPEGMIFVVGTEPASFDSRYWGFLNQRNVIGGLRPLI